ncbi:MAG: hypothetical protein KAQ63_01130, partial [Candidatus Moranbacteria bacterium]|nr:hypothetical protein [Candidatus Moranbacteria bacterium]
KEIIPTENDLASLTKTEKAAIDKKLFSLADLKLSKLLIEKEKVEKREVAPITFFVKKGRFSKSKEYGAGIFILDKKNIACMRFFSNSTNIEEGKSNIMNLYSRKIIRDFDKYVVEKLTGNFCQNLPDQEVTVYKLKCFIAGNLRYLSVVVVEMEKVNYFVVFYNRSRPNSKMGDVLALFFDTVEKREI